MTPEDRGAAILGVGTTMGDVTFSAALEVAQDGVHENVTVAHTENGVTTVTEGCTMTVATDESGYRSFDVLPPDLA